MKTKLRVVQMLELIDKDVETAITNICHMFKSMMRKWMENTKNVKDCTFRDEDYSIWDKNRLNGIRNCRR